jgi:hypothetical protein
MRPAYGLRSQRLGVGRAFGNQSAAPLTRAPAVGAFCLSIHWAIHRCPRPQEAGTRKTRRHRRAHRRARGGGEHGIVAAELGDDAVFLPLDVTSDWEKTVRRWLSALDSSMC